MGSDNINRFHQESVFSTADKRSLNQAKLWRTLTWGQEVEHRHFPQDIANLKGSPSPKQRGK
ncbi:hypothetical protein CHS0354_034239, partial [Potamilus streckersoni]